jgi:hypothetical protein
MEMLFNEHRWISDQKKANYLKLLLLKDDLKYFHNMLSLEAKDSDSWIAKLRNTRQVFLILNNVQDMAHKVNLRGSEEYIAQTRQLRKTLSFINHFRNKAVGHLDKTLFERAVQWHPMLFSSEFKKYDECQIMEGNRAVIEASINSFLDEEGIQKIFRTEIDLMYPPDFNIFYEYLWKAVTESIDWLSLSLSIASSEIKYHDQNEIFEIAAVAGLTEFDLKKESKYDYNEIEYNETIKKTMNKLQEKRIKKEVIDFIKKNITHDAS